MENKRVEHCFSTQNDIANDGGAASTGPKHTQTSAVNEQHRKKKAGANQICRATTSDATPHAVQLSLRPLLRLCATDKRKQKNVEKRIPT